MSGCLIANSKTKTCETASKIGGVNGRLWLYNLKDSDGQKVTYTEVAGSNVISDISFTTGEGLFPVEGEKYAHNFTYALAMPGVNKYYTQVGNIKTIVDTAEDITWLNEVCKASDLGIIYEDNNQRFIVLGQNNGLKAIEGDLFDSGTEAATDVGTTVSLQGEEKDAPYKLFFDTDYDTTLSALVALEAPVA